MAKSPAHKREFARRFRRQAFGWRSRPAIQRVKEAVSEIKQMARRNPLLAAEGAVLFLEKVSPALEQVDSSSGAIGTAVNRAIAELVAIIASAPADAATREAWLERLWQAHADDQIPYIDSITPATPLPNLGMACAVRRAPPWATKPVGEQRGSRRSRICDICALYGYPTHCPLRLSVRRHCGRGLHVLSDGAGRAERPERL